MRIKINFKEMNDVQLEKQDLKEPLPDWKKEDLKEVVLYMGQGSPPCFKIMSVLQYHNINYK